MRPLPPLRFRPLFRDYVWGGTRIRETLGKPAPSGTVAESWEIVDRQDSQSVVDGGPLDGRSLQSLMEEFGPQMVGPAVWERLNRPSVPPGLRGRFPLLLKFLDAERDLSVQVHPDDAMAAALDPPDFGKTEAWYVLAASPGARIYAGLQPGCDRESLAAAVREQRTADLLHSFEPSRGDCVFIPAGTVHAIGAGLLVLEIQQASDTTWRLFDWNRVDQHGRARELHIEPALRAADYRSGPVRPAAPQPSADGNCELLVSCPYFEIRRRKLDRPLRLAGDGLPRIFVVTAGRAALALRDTVDHLGYSDVRLLPATCPAVTLSGTPNSELIEITPGPPGQS